MGGTGIAVVEPFNAVADNPATYPSMLRPNFDVSISARSSAFATGTSTASRREAGFMGLAIGVPFAKGKWGLSLGVAPYTDVSYTMTDHGMSGTDAVTYTYQGSGGLDKVHAGLGRRVLAARMDSVGNLGHRLSIGANFNYIFGGIEQTRDAAYPLGLGYNNLRAFSSLNLKAPTGEIGMLWQDDLTRKRKRDDGNWRYGVGATVQLPVQFAARYTDVLSSYVVNSAGVETIRDSIRQVGSDGGSVEWPIGVGVGVSVSNSRWMFTAEWRERDFSAVKLDVPGYVLPAPLGQSRVMAAAARFVPASEGHLFMRSVYRAGIRRSQDYQLVNGQALVGTSMTLGLSLPLNALQTNSYLHIGGEFGQRGDVTNGLVRERYGMLWIGLTLTPWKLERWFEPYRIQ